MTWAVLQSAGANFFGSSVTATFPGNVASGTKIIAAVSSNWSTPPSTVQDGAANDLVFLGSAVNPSNGSVWLYAMDTPAGDVGTAPSITATWPSGNGQSIVIQEVSGLNPGTTPAQVVDYTPGTLTGTSATTGSPAYTSSDAGEYLVCVYGGHTASAALTAADGTWTLDPASQTQFSEATVEYKDSSGGAEAGGFGNASTGGWSVLMVGFQYAGQVLPDPWGFVQSASANFFGTSVTATFLNNVAAGNKIIAVVGSSFSTVPTSVRDGALNDWTLLGSKVTATGSVWLYALDVPAGDVGTKPAITATWSNSNGQSILIQEISGLVLGNTTAMLDGTPGTLSGTAAATGSPAYTSTAPNEYLVCAYADNNGNVTVVKQGAAWTLDANSQHVFSDASLEYGNSTNGAETSGFTGASTGGWSILTVAFRILPPAAAAGPQAFPARPGKTWLRQFRHRQQLFPPPGAAAAAAPAAPVVFAAPPARRGPHRASLGARGALAAGILAAGIGPPAVPAPHQPPAITHPAPHRASWRSGLGAPPNVIPQKRIPVTIFPRAAHRAAWHGGTGAPPNAAQQVKVPPTVFARKPHAAAWRGAAGAVPAALRQPFRPATVFTRAVHRASWRGGSGPAVAAVQGGGAPQPFKPVTVYARRPHGAAWKAGAGQPPAAARQPFRPVTVFTRTVRRAIWRGIAGPAPVTVQGGGVLQPARPATAWTRRPHGALWRSGRGAAPAAVPQPSRPVTVYARKAHAALWRAVTGRPPAAARQPRIPATVFTRPRHGAAWRGGAGSPAAPPPPFTVGALTASTAPGATLTASGGPAGVLTAAAATATLTATTVAAAASDAALYPAAYTATYSPAVPEGTLTAADTRTGGPS